MILVFSIDDSQYATNADRDYAIHNADIDQETC